MARDIKMVIQAPDGSIETEPHKMASCLRDHWQKVFTARPVTEEASLRSWCTAHPYGIRPVNGDGSHKWSITQQLVELAIKHSNNSSPGPDDIPYLARRRVGHLAVVVLHAVALQMQEESFY